MRSQPKALLALSIILIGVALSYPVQIMFLYGHGPAEIASVFAKMAPLNWVVVIGSLSSAYFAYRASPWLWTSFPILTVAVAWNNFLVSEIGEDYTRFATSAATLGFASLGTLLFTAEAWDILLHPEKRWWLRPVRKQIAAPVFVIPQQGDAFRAETFDLSSNGAFIRLSDPNAFTGVNAGDRISLRLTMGALTVLRCEAQVVRRAMAKGNYPKGLGIQFKNLNRYEARELRKYLSSV